MLSFQGGVRVPSYTASKSAVAGLTKALANEWAGKGVNVNAIAPGYIATNNTAALQADEARNRQILERIPAGRWGEPSRYRRRGGVPRLVGLRLCPRPYPRRGRGLAGALMGRVVAFGELLLRLTAPGRELLLQNGRLDVHVGGAEANVAVGLARLGHETAMVSRCPTMRSATPRRGICGATASMRRASRPGRGGWASISCRRAPACGRPTSSMTGRAAPSRLAGPDDFDWDRLLDGADLLHLSGVTPALGRGSADAAIAAAEAAQAQGRRGLVRRQFPGAALGALGRRSGGDPRRAGRARRHPVRQSSRHFAAARPRFLRRRRIPAARRGGGGVRTLSGAQA